MKSDLNNRLKIGTRVVFLVNIETTCPGDRGFVQINDGNEFRYEIRRTDGKLVLAHTWEISAESDVFMDELLMDRLSIL